MDLKILLFLFIITVEIATYGCDQVYKREQLRKLFDAKGRRELVRTRRGSWWNNWLCRNDNYCYACDNSPDGSGCCLRNQRCPSSSSSSGSGCFASTSIVKLENGKSVPMSELQIGDKVQAVSSDGQVTYSYIETFLHTQPNVVNKYKSITTSLNDTITLTGNHIIYARKTNTDKFNVIYGDEVSTGYEVLVQRNDYMIPAMVISVSTSKMQGACDPLTKEGNIIVNDVMASCYGSYDHNLAHFVTTPIQWFPIMDRIIGEEHGTSIYVNIAKHFKWVLPNGQTNA